MEVIVLGKKGHPLSARKRYLPVLIVLLLLAVAAISAAILWHVTHPANQEEGVSAQIRSWSGLSQSVEQEEYDFFKTLARRELDNRDDMALLDRKTRELASRSNAQFYLGSRLGLCQPYSFAAFKEELRHENARRKRAEEQGEVIYGPKEYDLLGYYLYITSNLRADTVSYLAEHADRELEDLARSYYDENLSQYRRPENIDYTLTQAGNTSSHTIRWGDLHTLGMTEPSLADALSAAHEGDAFECPDGAGNPRSVTVTAVEYKETSFEAESQQVLKDFLNNGYYDELVALIANQNPVQFNVEAATP